MDEGAINFLLSGRPFLAKVPKMRKFLSQGGHLTLERADNTNNTRWMDTCSSKGYLEAMVRGKGLTSLGSWDTLDSTTTPVLINNFAEELSKDDTPAE